MKNTQNVTVKSMTVAPGERKVQNKHDLIQHSAQEKKIAMLTNSGNDVIAFSIHYSLGIKRFYNTIRQYILYLVKSRMFM